MALSFAVTLEGMPVCALAATPTDAPSAASAQGEEPPSQKSGDAEAASTTSAQDKVAAPTGKQTATTERKTVATPAQKGGPASQAPQSSKKVEQPEKVSQQQTPQPNTTGGSDEASKGGQPEKTSQTPQTQPSSTTDEANQGNQSKATSTDTSQTNQNQTAQNAGSTPTEAPAPVAGQQASRPQSVNVGVRAVDEQGKSVEGATISVQSGTQRRPSNAAGTYDFNPGETVTVVADAPTYAHVEQTFVINGSPISIAMRKSEQAGTTLVSAKTPDKGQTQATVDTDSQNQAIVDRMAREFDASYGIINLLAFAPQYNSGINVASAIRQRLAGSGLEGLTVSVASSSDVSVIATNGTLGSTSTSEVVPYETAGSSACSFTLSLGGARATTSVHTVQIGYWSTNADGETVSTEMQKDVDLPNTFWADMEVPLFPPSTVPDNATFTWKLVSPDSAFTLKTDATDGTQMLVAHSQDHATSATLEAAMIPTKTTGYNFYFYPIRSFTLRMAAGAQVAAVNDPLHPAIRPNRAPSRRRRSLDPVTPTLVSAVVPTSIVPTPVPSPLSPASDNTDPASPVVSPSDSTSAAAAETTAATSGVSLSVGTHGTHASSTSASGGGTAGGNVSATSRTSASAASPSTSVVSSDATSATDVASPVSGPTVNEEGFLGALQSTVVTATSASGDVGVSSPGAPAAPLVPLAGVAMGIACITKAVASLARKGTKTKARK